MEELYAEAGCKPRLTGKYLVKKIGAILGIVILAFLVLFIPNMLVRVLAILGIVGFIYLFPMLNIEYEYIFCDGQVDFDKIMGGAKRKTMLKIDFDTVEVVAPIEADVIQNYKNIKVKDFSSKDSSQKVYAIIGKVGEENTKILFEPTAKMIEAMWAKSPRKVQK
ncbi:DUF6106 family protein [Velocimicrobium porci]|uniref:Uncharacterized protein n=1 Tax=Velocimicrobium porci TaxID=2606634 RepID=A0A6L5XVB4_9FIRM|nr:DUF6106 family protein [Velocimicrobium porci]MSS62549.1 hypothetical protein [Velocimicrobium porci]